MRNSYGRKTERSIPPYEFRFSRTSFVLFPYESCVLTSGLIDKDKEVRSQVKYRNIIDLIYYEVRLHEIRMSHVLIPYEFRLAHKEGTLSEQGRNSCVNRTE